MEERTSGTEDTIEERDTSIKENVKSKRVTEKHSGNLEHIEEIRHKNNKNIRRIIPVQRPRIYMYMYIHAYTHTHIYIHIYHQHVTETSGIEIVT